MRESNESRETITDYVSMWEPGFVRKDFPWRIEKRLSAGGRFG